MILPERGEPIGRIVPLTQPIEAQLESLRQAGLIAWSGKRLSALAPVSRTQGDRMVSGLLLEDRE